MATIQPVKAQFDAHLQPPSHLRELFKTWRKAKGADYDGEKLSILDTRSIHEDDRAHEISLSDHDVHRIYNAFCDFTHGRNQNKEIQQPCMFELNDLPGLVIVPQILPASVQLELLDQLFHQELSQPMHNTNLKMFHHVSYPLEAQSFFQLDQDLKHEPKDTRLHRPISTKQMLDKHLRWVTLGGQYDWTKKQYPDEKPPQFPPRIARLIKGIFPQLEPQAAILNLYSPGDTLSLHRDVSEECAEPLVSISIGCDALFLIANTDGSKYLIMKLRSGDAVLMSGQSRFAWHAVPKVLGDTCPVEVEDWPAVRETEYEEWKGWLAQKRINLNVRQMRP